MWGFELVLKKILINNLSQSLQFGSRWFLNVLLLRIMSISEFGLFSFLYSISNILVAVYPFGSSIYIFKKNTKNGNKYLIIESLAIICIFFIFSILIYLVLLIFDIKFNGINALYYAFILAFILSINLILSSYIKSLEKFSKELIGYILFFILLSFAIIYIYLNGTVDITTIFKLLILINFLISIYFFQISEIKSVVFQSINIKDIFKKRLFYGLQEIQTAIYAQSSMIILFYLLTTELYGVYRALFILVMPISLITFSTTQVLITYLKKHLSEIKKTFRKLLFYIFFFAFSVTLFLYIAESYLFQLIKLNDMYQKEFLFMIIVVFVKIIMTPYIAFLVVQDMQKVRFYANLLGSVFLLTTLFIFVNKDDLFNAILIYFISISLVLAVKIILAERKLKRL